MNILEAKEYKSFVLDWIQQSPRKGRGMLSRLARHLNVHAVVISQVLRGERHFTEEQALQVADFLGLGEMETDFFLLLVQRERAGTHALRDYYARKLQELRLSARELKERMRGRVAELDEEAKSVFYSDWIYSAIRLYCAIESVGDVREIAGKLQIPLARVNEALRFLKKYGLVAERNGRLEIGTQSTHLGSRSPFINSHRKNWRIKGLESLNDEDEYNLFYSGPMVVAHKDVPRIRKQLVELIANVTKSVADSPCERTQCLNIDWYAF